MSREEEVSEGFDVSVLSGVGPSTKRKLNDAGIYTVSDLVVHSATQLEDILGSSKDEVARLQKKARDELADVGLIEGDFVSADELFERQKQVRYITTGSSNLDELLEHGIETRSITEFYGEYGTGKTQLCHALSVNVQLPEEEGGLDSGAIYIDTEKTFRPDRILEISEGLGLDGTEELKGIHVAKAMNSSHLLLLISELGKKIRQTGARLVVIDSAVAPFRVEYVGRGQLAERQQRLNIMMHDLTRMSELHDVAVVITNQVLSQPDVFFGDPTKPIGGHVVSHTVTYRLYLRKARNARVASIVDSPHHPPGEAMFKITTEGIRDPE